MTGCEVEARVAESEVCCTGIVYHTQALLSDHG